jgi:hypothetical protein
MDVGTFGRSVRSVSLARETVEDALITARPHRVLARLHGLVDRARGDVDPSEKGEQLELLQSY